MGEDRPREETLQATAERSEPRSTPAVHASDAGAGAGSLEELFRQHHERVFRIAFRITGDPGDAEDAMQTVFLRLARREEELDTSQNVAGYFSRAATHAALDLLRAKRRSRSVPLEGVEAASPAAGPERGSLDRELRRRLRQGLAELPPRSAQIFALRYFEGESNRDIARLLGMSPTSVAVILHRARGRLRQELAPYGGGSP